MLRKFLFLILSITVLSLPACTSQQRDEVKKVSAEKLGEGIASVLIGDVIKCDDNQAAQEYVKQKTCAALKVDCSGQAKGLMSFSTKGIVAQFVCKTAIRMALPVILPSTHLPSELKQAGCSANSLDQLAKELVPKLCNKL